MKAQFALLAVAFALVGCGGTQPPAPTAPAASDSASPATSDTAPAQSAAPTDTAAPTTSAAPPPPPPPPPGPDVKATIGGKSLSQISLDDIQAAIKKAGWAMQSGASVGGRDDKGREMRTFPIEKDKGKVKGVITLVRPVPGQGVAPDSSISSASASASSHTDEATYTEDDVLVAIKTDKKADGDKLLKALIKAPPPDKKDTKKDKGKK